MVAQAGSPLPGLRVDQLQKAIESLLKYSGQRKADTPSLFDEDDMIYLIMSLKQYPNKARKDKPKRIRIPHPLTTTEGAEVCLFVKDHKGEGHTAAKKRLAKLQNNGGVTKVIGLSKLKTKYSSHEERRQLCAKFDVFLADSRILPSLPPLIGKAFFKKKKQPIPVLLSGKDWTAQIRRAVEATYLFPGSGSCINVRVAHSGMTAEQVLENVLAALPAVVEQIPKKWANVQGLFLKTSESVALPVYQTLELGQGAAIQGGASQRKASSKAPAVEAA